MALNKQNVLIIASNFLPEESGIAVYATDLATKVLDKNYDVTVVTGLPYYPWWKTLEKFSHISPGITREENLEVIRIRQSVPRNAGAMGRALLEFSFWANGKKALKNLHAKDFDLVISIMPTVAAGLLGRLIARRGKIPGIVVFQDLSSLGALQSGVPGAHFFYGIAKFLEFHASSWAAKIVVISNEMETVISKLVKNKVPIKVIHNYAVLDIETLDHVEERRKFRFLESEYIILHTGNIGFKQDLLNVVAAAKLLERETSIKFLIVGHGNQEEIIRLAIKDCKNIELMPFVSKSDYPRILAAADVLLVNERPSLREMSLPSKLTSYLTSGRPVIAAVAEQSATRKFLQGAALIVEPGNPQLLADAIVQLKTDSSLQTSFCELGKKFAYDNFSSIAGRANYLEVVHDVLTIKHE